MAGVYLGKAASHPAGTPSSRWTGRLRGNRSWDSIGRPPLLRFDDARRTLDLGVHDLLEASAPAGDLRVSLAWSSATRLRAGQRAHVSWQSSRAEAVAGYASEVSVRHRLVVDDWTVTISGRVDGLYEEGDALVVEEVKSSSLPEASLEVVVASDFPDWTRQLQLYLYLLAARGQPAVGRLVLSSILDGSWRVLHVEPEPTLEEQVQDQLRALIAEREARIEWYARRREAEVPFAHPRFREGQEALVSTIASALLGGQHLLLGAPTGLGKTAAVLLAALRVAYRTDRRVFFATARSTQQRLAEETVAAMVARGLPIRAVSLRAREKVCLNEAVICRADACRFAAAYHDKLQAAALPGAAWTGPPLRADDVVAIGSSREVCPHALSLDLGAGADLIIGDYNYLFDSSVRPGRLFEEGLEPWIAVVDEAHNLPERAMGYASPELPLSLAVEATTSLEETPENAPFRAWATEVRAWLAEGWERCGAEDPAAWGGEDGAVWSEDAVALPLDRGLRARVRELADQVEALALPYALLRVSTSLRAAREDDAWQRLARAVLRLRGALDRADDETVAIWRRPEGKDKGGLALLCRDPAPLLGPLFQALGASVLLSATLEPSRFYQDLCGLEPSRALAHRAMSPFPPENRRVLIVPTVTTAFKHRARDREATAAVISETVAAVPGNVAVFFTSFGLRDDLAPLLELDGRPALWQDRAMDEEARAGLLGTLAEGGRHVLLAVLGGIFSEGVDLPGSGLLAAVIVGLGLPQVGLERRLLQDWYETRYGEGFRYAYQVPGLARVVQAAGRVIRTPEDRGAIVLIDRRFLQYEVQAFFPPDWTPERSTRPAAALAGFWDEAPGEG